MSGPVAAEDSPPSPWEAAGPESAVLELLAGRDTQVGAVIVHRVLPRRPRRTVGAWCFADQVGPMTVTDELDVSIAPHPHMGLHTVTWLLSGELVHYDSLGSEQPIRPGQLNLMTAGRGVVHSEENTGRYRGPLQGIQLWVAQPEATRHGGAAFEHHAMLPEVELPGARATVLVGEFAGARSSARRDSELVGVELDLTPSGAIVPLDASFEHALVVLSGAVSVADSVIEPGVLAYLGTGRDELAVRVREPARALLLGGEPFPETLLMWWNFVARTRDEVTQARDEWMSGAPRFGSVRSDLARIEVGPPPWGRDR